MVNANNNNFAGETSYIKFIPPTTTSPQPYSMEEVEMKQSDSYNLQLGCMNNATHRTLDFNYNWYGIYTMLIIDRNEGIQYRDHCRGGNVYVLNFRLVPTGSTKDYINDFSVPFYAVDKLIIPNKRIRNLIADNFLNAYKDCNPLPDWYDALTRFRKKGNDTDVFVKITRTTTNIDSLSYGKYYVGTNNLIEFDDRVNDYTMDTELYNLVVRQGGKLTVGYYTTTLLLEHSLVDRVTRFVPEPYYPLTNEEISRIVSLGTFCPSSLFLFFASSGDNVSLFQPFYLPSSHVITYDKSILDGR